MSDLLSQIDKTRLPRHIAIIMDGNGRWAKEQGQDRLFGHYHGVESVRDIVEGAVGKIRENIKISKAYRLTADSPIATYVHHDRTKGTAVISEGAGANGEALRKVAIHAVAFPPEVVNKEELPQDKINAEIEIETQRAINEGKPENIARNIAQGRVNKEYIKRVVLLEQPFYLDPNKTVSQYLSEEAKGATVKDFKYLAVGASN